MPRTARIHYPGGLFHVISRFVAGQFLLDASDLREAYVELLGRAAQRTDARILSYCVMSNHTHVVLVQGDDPLERLFRPLHTGIAWRVNAQREGCHAKGPVLAQRPRAILVDQDSYLLELVRYVHNNPVRAGVVNAAAQTTWSSHRAYTGEDKPPTWLHTDHVLQRFGESRDAAARAFDAFVNENALQCGAGDFGAMGLELAQGTARRAIGDGFRVSDAVVGDAAFAERIGRDLLAADDAVHGGALRTRILDPQLPDATIDDVLQAVCSALGVDCLSVETGSQQRELVMARRLLTWVWVSRFRGRQVEVSRALRASTSAVARWYAGAREVMADLDALADDVVHRVARACIRLDARPPMRAHFEVRVDL